MKEVSLIGDNPKRFSAVEGDVNKAIMEKHIAENAFVCKNGIIKDL